MSIHKLTATQVEKLTRGVISGSRAKLGTRAKYGDGGGLYLQIKPRGASWIFRYEYQGQERYMGLGPVNTVSLDEARRRANEKRLALLDGCDPLGARARLSMTFKQAFLLWFDGDPKQPQSVGYKQTVSQKTRARVMHLIETHAQPIIGDLRVDLISTPHIVRIVAPLSYDNARFLRGRIEGVLDLATANGFREGDNPARASLLENVIAPKGKAAKVEHFAALPYPDLPDFMPKLRERQGIAARALEFVILSACRSGDILGQKESPPLCWSDIIDAHRVWATPRTKNGLQHLVPLCDRAIEILTEMRAMRLEDARGRVFPMGNDAMRLLLRDMGLDVDVHGFRSTFKTWAEHESGAENKVIEAVMAHGLTGDKVELAYMRGDFFVQRRKLLATYADYADGKIKATNVIELRKIG